MIIEQQVWGSTQEGEAIILYTLKNSLGSEIQLCNLGASIVSVKFADRNGKVEETTLGYSTLEAFQRDTMSAGRTIGRFANRIAKGKMTVAGKTYTLECNNGENHLHGGSHGYGKRIWESFVENNRVYFNLLSEDGDAGYPNEVNVQAIYDFDDENSFEITYKAKSNGLTPVNLTNHVYWNLSGDDSTTIEDHILTLNCSKGLETSAGLIPTGKVLDLKGTPQDFTEGKAIKTDLHADWNFIKEFKGYDHFFIQDGWKKNILSQLGNLYDPKSGRNIEILTSQAGCMVYTANTLGGGEVPTRDGKSTFKDYAGVAIECQGYPDAPNHPEFPSVLLDKDEVYCQKIVFRLSTK